MYTPIFSRLKAYSDKNRISFAMPGHKNGRGLNTELLKCDVTELLSTLDLHSHCDTIKDACNLLSDCYGSDESYISTCGSTSCIQAMLVSALNPGDTLLAASDCHISIINTCALCGFNLRFIPKTINQDFLIPDKFYDVEEILNKYSDIKAVIITSPTYYGVCADIHYFAKVCHKHNIPLLVDEAHGAHFPASPLLPDSAVKFGADAVCQSAHKTLNALTGSAFLHVNGNIINRDRLKAAFSMFQTSSPSYVIAASADIARAELCDDNNWSNICNLCDLFRKKICRDTKVTVLNNDDKTRLVLNFSAYEITGTAIEHLLSNQYNIDIEMSDTENIILIVTASNTSDDLDFIYNALIDILKKTKNKDKKLSLNPPPVCTSLIQPKKAFFAKSHEILLDNAVGYISASSVCAYPPGIPIIAMGAKITKEQIDFISHLYNIGAKITGLNNGSIKVI